MIRAPHFCSFFVTLCIAALVSCSQKPAVESDPQKQPEKTAKLDQFPKLQGNQVKYNLEDGEVLHREHPDSFWIPPKEQRESLATDQIVKLVFRLTDGSNTQTERMWVIVKGGDRTGYSGVLDNDPVCTDQIKSGHPVSFEPRQVIDIYEAEK